MRVLQVAGSFPQEPCGIGDYTARLMEALSRRGIETAVLTRRWPISRPEGVSVIAVTDSWGVRETDRLCAAVREFQPEIIHLQYPGLGYGYSLGPHLFFHQVARFRAPLVLTLHEYKQAHRLRRMSEWLLLARADAVVFTTAEESRHVRQRLGWLFPSLRRTVAIPIGSNLPELLPARTDYGYDPKLFCYWGMFHAGKGIELLLAGFATALQRERELRLQLVGARREKDEVYIAELKRMTRQLGIADRVSFCFDLAGADIVQLLCRACGVVLPFRDGATFRRGTLIAALRLGLPAVTLAGPDTPAELRHQENILFASGPDDIAQQLLNLHAKPELRAALARGARALGSLFDWDSIAGQHVDLYQALTVRRS